MLRVSFLALLAIAGCSATTPPPCPCAPASAAAAPTSAPPASQRAAVDLLKKALPGVVLLLNQRSDNKIGFGSGVLLDEHGLVLTNLHVVANASSIGAMLHDPNRVSYTPMDGGLARYFFENQKDVIPGHLVRGDPTLDLAIVHIEADTSRYARLPFRKGPVEVGEQVLALGHPQETVWSFTSGMVSSIHLGTIQHDAAINPGNSGGPLIDMSGQVVGVNTAKLLSTAGVGFARPIAMASYLIDQATAPFDPDLATPEKAILSCARAAELASPSYYNCLDWEAIYTAHEQALPETIKSLNLSKEAGEKFNQAWRKLGKDFWIGLLKRAVIAEAEGRALEAIGAEHGREVRAKAGSWGPVGAKAGDDRGAKGVDELQRMISDFKAFQAEFDQELLKRNGLKVDRRNPRGRVDVRKMGIRVDAVANPAPDRAWVGASGRNLDSSIYRYSAYFVRVGREWKERHPFPEDAATLPEGWPPPLSSYPKDLAKARAYLTAVIMSGDAAPEKR